MIRRLYAHNFRCFQNFELKLAGDSTFLLIGRNGAGKSTVRRVLEVLQAVARGTNRVRDLVTPLDFTRGGQSEPMRLEIECELDGHVYTYTLVLELPPGFVELRVVEESLRVGTQAVYARELAQIAMPKHREDLESRFRLDWHLVALPLVQDRSEEDPLFKFKRYLRSLIILAPVPSLISGESKGDTLEPQITGVNFAEWFTGLLALSPAAYAQIDSFMRAVFPDFQDVQNRLQGSDSRSLTLKFEEGGRSVSLPFSELSDGEKCYLVAAVVLASLRAYGPSLCFWDEPDNHLALSEIGHLVMALRQMPDGCQFIATSHHPETIRRFARENTLLLHRASHLEPTQVRPVGELQIQGDLVDTLIRGDELS